MKGTHLDQLVGAALSQAAGRATLTPLPEVKQKALATPPPRDFADALRRARARGAPLIAEIKRASPSKGEIAPNLDAAATAQQYERGGAACISVLTEGSFFGGSLRDLRDARAVCGLPLLRKDFLVTPYQLFEARAHGADAVLLIAAALEPARLVELRGLARELGLTVLLEVHAEEELEAARAAQPDLLGINARDLKTLAVDKDVFARLAPLARGLAPLVAESGVKSAADVQALMNQGADALLVGESVAKADFPADAVRALVEAVPGAAAVVR